MEPPPAVLNHEQRITLAGLLVEAVHQQDAEPGYIEDPEYHHAPVPWMPDFRLAPEAEWLELGGDWGLRWAAAGDEFEHDRTQEEEEWEWEWESLEISRLHITPESVSFSAYGDDHYKATVVITAGSIFVDDGDGLDYNDPEATIFRATQSLTGWISTRENGTVVDEPVRCADCGKDYLLDGDEEQDCPRCNSTWIRVGPVHTTPPELDGEASRLVNLLLEAGLLTLCGDLEVVSAALRPVLSEAGDGAVLCAALMACPSVDEVYASDALFDDLLACW
ncbi:MAG: hypothetical protein ACI8RZ_007984 [Myxococcota bacterium]